MLWTNMVDKLDVYLRRRKKAGCGREGTGSKADCEHPRVARPCVLKDALQVLG